MYLVELGWALDLPTVNQSLPGRDDVCVNASGMPLRWKTRKLQKARRKRGASELSRAGSASAWAEMLVAPPVIKVCASAVRRR
jgi:hypothetical protein